MGTTRGIYQIGAASGTVGAGISSNSPIFSWRFTGPSNTCLIRKIFFSAGDTSTSFTAGIFSFQMFIARAFTANDTGGSAVAPAAGSNDCKLATAYPPSLMSVGDIRISSTAALGAGTRTLDAQPFAGIVTSDPATAGNSIVAPGTPLFTAYGADERPVQLVQNEGFVIQATVPATGTWTFAVQVLWEEVLGLMY